ncbi:MAG: CPBP family intramembrane glutamic endopeptidase [Candidatus Acidiferrum sp.]
MPWDFWLIFFVLGAVLPWRGHQRLKKLLATPQMDPRGRLALYFSTIAFQWLAVAVVSWRAWARGLSLEELGLVVHGLGKILLASIVGAAILSGLQWLNLRRMGRSSGKSRAFLQELAKRIFPQSRKELLPFLALAVTAGLCEEFLYRGFAMAALLRAGLPIWSVALLSSVLFAMAHLYQGRGGIVGTFLVGAIFAAARIAYSGIAPVVFWHIAIDAVAGLAGPKYLLRPASSAESEEIHSFIG